MFTQSCKIPSFLFFGPITTLLRFQQRKKICIFETWVLNQFCSYTLHVVLNLISCLRSDCFRYFVGISPVLTKCLEKLHFIFLRPFIFLFHQWKKICPFKTWVFHPFLPPTFCIIVNLTLCFTPHRCDYLDEVFSVFTNCF